MRVWVILGSDGATDTFPLGVYVDRGQAERRVKRENASQSYYEYRLLAATLYTPQTAKAEAGR